MNIIAELRAFKLLQPINRLSAGQRSLWLALILIANELRWAEWFSVANITLQAECSLSKEGIIQARNVLKQKGYIDYKANGTKATSYKIISLCWQDNTRDCTRDYTRDCTRDYTRDCTRDYTRDCTPLINNKNKTKQNETKQNIEENLKRKAPQAEAENCPYEKIKDLYHGICVSYPKLRNIDGNRKKAIAARWRTHKSLDIFEELFQIAESSSFLKGSNDRDWSADFDWLMKPTNFAKVLEHKYDDSNGGTAKKTVFTDFESKHDYDIEDFERKALESRMGCSYVN